MVVRPVGAVATALLPLAFGHWAVVVFIVLSGFCLTLPVVDGGDTLRGGAGRFYWRRARRILPPYYAAVAVSLGLIATLVGTPNGSHWDFSVPVTRRGLLAAALLVGDDLNSYQVNHALWSVQVETKIYILFPVLVWGFRRAGPWPAACGTAAAAFAAGAVAHRCGLDFIRVHFVAVFALGMLAAAVPRRPPRRPAWAGPGLAVAASLATLAMSWRYGVVASFRQGYVLDVGVGLAAAPALVSLARRPGGAMGRALSARPLVLLGGASYSFYLLHAPLVQVAYRYAVRPLGLPPAAALSLLVALGLGLTLAATVPFYVAVERPFLSRQLRVTQVTARSATE